MSRWMLAALVLVPWAAVPAAQGNDPYTESNTTAADAYVRAAGYIARDIPAISGKIAVAAAQESPPDPDQDSDLVDAVRDLQARHRQLRDNTAEHDIGPPNLRPILQACAKLRDPAAELQPIDDTLTKVRGELAASERVDRRLTLRFKLIPIVGMTKILIEGLKALQSFAPSPQAEPLTWADFFKEVIQGSGEEMLDRVDPATAGPDDPATAPQQMRPDTRQLYLAHQDDINRRMGEWAARTYPNLDPQSYAERLRGDENMRDAFINHLLLEIRDEARLVVKGRRELIGQLEGERAKIEAAKPNILKYRKICDDIAKLGGWTVPQRRYGTIEFARTDYQVTESAGSFLVEATRTGGSDSDVSVHFETADETARAGTDYARTEGTLRWAKGEEGPRTIRVAIVSQSTPFTIRTFTVRLENVAGGARLGSNVRARVAIAGKPAPAAAKPPEVLPPKPLLCNYLTIAPQRIEVRPNETVTFTATAVYMDYTTKDVTYLADWRPGPANRYTAPADARFNETIRITATYHDPNGDCSGTTEITMLATFPTAPMSHADELGAKGEIPGPADYTWYALCRKDTGDVVYAESRDLTRYFVMAGPFPGPRNAQFWIEQNCPRWRCTESGACAGEPARTTGAGWSVVCSKTSHAVGLTRSPNSVSDWVWASSFLGEPDARLWAQQHCPSWTCDASGACATPLQTPRTGGNWAVACSRSGGGVVLTEHPNPTTEWVWASNLAAEPDARMWANQHCPSWRCDRDGRCLPGSQPLENTSAGRPVEVPPNLYTQDEILRMFGDREAARNAARTASGSGTSTATSDTSTGSATGESGQFTSQGLAQAMQAQRDAAAGGHSHGEPGTGAGSGTNGTTTPSTKGTPAASAPATSGPPETKRWYGIETKVVYDWQGRTCTLTDSYEGEATPSGLPGLTNEARGKALGPVRGAGDRTVQSVTSRVYAGPASAKPSYPGKTGVQCTSAK